MKQCQVGKLTQLVPENGRTFHLRHKITLDLWKTMLVCQVCMFIITALTGFAMFIKLYTERIAPIRQSNSFLGIEID